MRLAKSIKRKLIKSKLIKSRLIKSKLIESRFISRIILFLLLCCFLLPCSNVYANGPKLASRILIEVSNWSEDAKWVDILILLDEDNEEYEEPSDSLLNSYGFTRESEIVTYKENGYQSYCLNFANASKMIELPRGLAKDSSVFGEFEHYNYIFDISRKIIIVLLDENGDIVQKSKPYTLKTKAVSSLKYGYMHYDASTLELSNINEYQSGMGVLFLMGYHILYWFIPLGITLFIEVLLARIMKLNKLKIVVIINIITNFLLYWFVVLCEFRLFPYALAVLIGEIFVYIAEFLLYVFIVYRNSSKKKIFQYVFLANTLSLVLTLLVNEWIYGIFVGFLNA